MLPDDKDAVAEREALVGVVRYLGKGGLSGNEAQSIKRYRLGGVRVPAVAKEVIDGRQGDQGYCRRTEHGAMIALKS